jgi:hypothetical protein
MAVGKFSLSNAIIAVIGLAAVAFGGTKYFAKDPNQIQYEAPANAPVLHVLFLGNSLTFFNDLPHMFGAVAASDTQSPVNMQVEMGAISNATLTDLLQSPQIVGQLKSRHWDYVVLQEHRTQLLDPQLFPGMDQAAMKWGALIRDNGAKPVIYEVWARRAGLDAADPATIQAQIDRITNGVATQINAFVVPAGDYWGACRALKGAPDLFNPDGGHPGVAGTYLNALLFYRFLTGHSVEHVGYVPPGVAPAAAQFLKSCASYGSGK